MKAKAAPVAYIAEPPAVYLVRPAVVIDCSVFVAVIFKESLEKAGAELIGGRTLHAPYLLDHELANVATKKRRTGTSEAIVAKAMDFYLGYDITLHRVSPDVVLPLAETYAISAYDAAYLALAAGLRVPLVTFDHKLGKAAVRHLGSLE